MSYNVVLTRSFKHSIKQLEKRFRHVKDDVQVAIQVLLQTPTIYLLLLYAKSDREDVTDRELKRLLDELADEDEYYV